MPAGAACCKHEFFLAQHALMSRALIHHVEYLGLIGNEFLRIEIARFILAQQSENFLLKCNPFHLS